VAVAAGTELLAMRHVMMQHGQAEALLPMVEEVMRAAGCAVTALGCVAVTTGPGSFTGIRVGLAAARGIALANDLPLIGVSSFVAARRAATIAPPRASAVVLVALESRRADLYVQLFDHTGQPLSEPAPVLPEALAAAAAVAAKTRPLMIVGDAAARAAVLLAGRHDTLLVEDVPPAVIGLVETAIRQWRVGGRGGAVNPLYLRPPNVTPAGARQGPARR
jgi:tRNA threonylcarbamoyladenosine biosynthesis protein TsaB